MNLYSIYILFYLYESLFRLYKEVKIIKPAGNSENVHFQPLSELDNLITLSRHFARLIPSCSWRHNLQLTSCIYCTARQVLYALYPLVRCITIVKIVKIYSPGKMNQDIQLCCECQDQSSVGDSRDRHGYHYISGILNLDLTSDMRKVRKKLPRAVFLREKFPQKCLIPDCFQLMTKGHI